MCVRSFCAEGAAASLDDRNLTTHSTAVHRLAGVVRSNKQRSAHVRNVSGVRSVLVAKTDVLARYRDN